MQDPLDNEMKDVMHSFGSKVKGQSAGSDQDDAHGEMFLELHVERNTVRKSLRVSELTRSALTPCTFALRATDPETRSRSRARPTNRAKGSVETRSPLRLL